MLDFYPAECQHFQRWSDYSGILISRTLDFSNFLISRTNFWPPIFSNQFLFPLEVQEVEILLYFQRFLKMSKDVRSILKFWSFMMHLGFTKEDPSLPYLNLNALHARRCMRPFLGGGGGWEGGSVTVGFLQNWVIIPVPNLKPGGPECCFVWPLICRPTQHG